VKRVWRDRRAASFTWASLAGRDPRPCVRSLADPPKFLSGRDLPSGWLVAFAPSSVLHPDPPPRLGSANGFGHPLQLAPSGDLAGGPDGASQVPTRSLCARNGLRPRQSGGASHTGAVHVAFATTDRLGLCNFSDLVAQSHSSHNRCVRFSPAVTGRTCNTRYRAARYALPGRDFHPLDRASFAWRTRCSPDPLIERLKRCAASPAPGSPPTAAVRPIGQLRPKTRTREKVKLENMPASDPAATASTGWAEHSAETVTNMKNTLRFSKLGQADVSFLAF